MCSTYSPSTPVVLTTQTADSDHSDEPLDSLFTSVVTPDRTFLENVRLMTKTDRAVLNVSDQWITSSFDNVHYIEIPEFIKLHSKKHLSAGIYLSYLS
ncbi:hypothetical protein T265_04331 [Opisthorchis viverrini]|uniref:Uncharacterized protein n=1 Tax=Opisthorchis viverrini TaxID=6198 RepID=A0A074ZSZ0_OPIVI|nr:hypothetical protein T265_04331 [Opisthorchis viverrini]KER28952.1 hypothetical protein T265_04331 [Opisthorchis viverrini]